MDKKTIVGILGGVVIGVGSMVGINVAGAEKITVHPQEGVAKENLTVTVENDVKVKTDYKLSEVESQIRSVESQMRDLNGKRQGLVEIHKKLKAELDKIQ